ncbi:OmpA family protein [Acinetobacter nosocomialis]|uniref:OmpA family protein n=1 Tax=Acinetobacter nosocomialis TaxID=106654 RepID=UPI0026FAB035|nr:OmpA family protein [Acinetobacter nosocomialis]MDO7195774.1 OmpA family protein [Acinetobacter nosocomialis]
MKKLFIMCLAAGIFSGCSTGTLITKEGTTDNPKWHKANNVILNKNLGTFPNLQSLSQVRQGMTKDQLYELIGRPQYDDGWRPREWNYLFHFNTPGQGENGITTCQFKVLFNQSMIANSFYWNPIHPENTVCPPTLNMPKKEESKQQVSVKRYTLGADALFAFDKSDLNNLNPKGREDLDNLVAELHKFKEIRSIRILGYTDYLGKESYNLKLSQKRAETIKQYFLNNQINAQVLSAQGLGEHDPVKYCANNLSRNFLVQCLQPNRRVVIEIDGIVE